MRYKMRTGQEKMEDAVKCLPVCQKNREEFGNEIQWNTRDKARVQKSTGRISPAGREW
jgi:hypothetical protein